MPRTEVTGQAIITNAPLSAFNTGSHGHAQDVDVPLVYDYGDDILNEDGSATGLTTNMFPIPSGTDPESTPTGIPRDVAVPPLPAENTQAPLV